jgi:acetyl esterase/lipase
MLYGYIINTRLPEVKFESQTRMNANTKPVPMELSQLAPELRESIKRIPNMPVANPLGRQLVRMMLKLMAHNSHFDDIQLEKTTTASGVKLRIYTPTRALTGAALLWIHGGGMVIGNAIRDDLFCAETARELGIVVVSTEYRLAPEFPFPAALDDCHAAWDWLQESAAQRAVDNTRIAIGGQSAGGGLAAGLVQRIHDEGGTQPAAQWLFCPMLDDRTAAQHGLDVINHKVWNNQQNRFGWSAFLGTAPGADQSPAYAVPARRGDLSGLPTGWIGCGDIELFFDEDKTYAERLNEVGTACTLDVVPGAPHGFESAARNTKLAQDYVSRARNWLGQALAANRSPI